mmetsp:Transcript_15489/g.27167  ORF Transcript_15489/g.27167 Transcript_15489/m.27167 type:complete len:619 (-) Transcript_15489:168-2024(-)
MMHSACNDAIANLSSSQLVELWWAAGKALPSDAGHFSSCTSWPWARYLLLKLLASPAGGGESTLALGLCLPKACHAADVPSLVANSTVVRSLLPDLSVLEVKSAFATDPLDLSPVGPGFFAAVAVVVLLVVIVLAATVRTCRSGLLDAFALTGPGGSLQKLVELPASRPTDALNGLRVLSMAWIILGHSFLMPEGVSGYRNPEDIADGLNRHSAESNPLLMLVLQAEVSVDTFFFLSGFLLSHLTLKELRQSRMNVSMAVVMRYLRLTPSLAFVMLIYYQIWPHLAYGPFAVTLEQSIVQRCQGSWWSELTYTMNFIPFDSDKVCMGWTWYLGDDMIFFVFGIAILPLYHRRKILGWLCVLALIGASLGVTAWLIAKHHLSVYVFDAHYAQYSYWAYSKPYCRAPAYLVGLCAAWVLQELEVNGMRREEQRSPSCSASLAALAATGLLLLLVFLPATDFGSHKNSWNDFENILLLDLGRLLWAAALAVLTLLCYFGHLPRTEAFLAHRWWTPFVRLTYGAYLLHPLVIKLAAGTSTQYYTFSGMDLFYRWFGNTAMAYSLAIGLWCLVERPVMTLTTGALKKRRALAADAQQKAETRSPAATPLTSAAATASPSSPSA